LGCAMTMPPAISKAPRMTDTTRVLIMAKLYGS